MGYLTVRKKNTCITIWLMVVLKELSHMSDVIFWLMTEEAGFIILKIIERATGKPD
ncbi:hypothetical protein [Peribacillus butanolivorans]|uniref:hypothetical protein n=1 Tax=Peribacillus butanolivorans TaxID=421767 RepID=UPI0035D964A7